MPSDAPVNWALTFSQQVGDVVMWLRDAVPPGQGSYNANDSNIESWASDYKNQGPYSYVGHDDAGTYTFTTPPLRPGQAYYAGFRSNSSATFSVSSATSGGTIGTLPVLDFYTGTLNTSIPANSSVLYRIPVPEEATRMKWSATHAETVQLRLEQGSIPASDGTQQHYYSSGIDSVINNVISATTWPWQPNQSYYLRIVNNADSAATVSLTLHGKNAANEDEDDDGLPDAWENAQYGEGYNYGSYDANADPDNDDLSNFLEYLLGGNPTLPSSGLLPAVIKAPGSSNVVFTYKRKIAATGVTQVIEHATSLSPPWTPAVHGTGGVTIITAPVPGDATTEQVTVTIPSTSTSRFVRLKASR